MIAKTEVMVYFKLLQEGFSTCFDVAMEPPRIYGGPTRIAATEVIDVAPVNNIPNL